MSDINDKLSSLEKMIENQAVESESVSVDKLSEESQNTQESGDFEPKTHYIQPTMTQEQANAIIEVAKDTNDFINVKLSQKTNDLIENDDNISKQFTDLAKDTVQQSINTYSTKNKKQEKKNYFELNEKDVISLGGDKSSTQGQQFSIVLIKRFFWILFMATLGTFFAAPLSVIIELFQGISFKNVEKEEYTADNGESKTRWLVKRHRLGIAGTIIGWIIGLAFWGLEIFLIYKFYFVFLWLVGVVFVLLLLINIFFGANINKLFSKIKNKIKKTDNDIVEEKNIVIEEDYD